ncbi:MAG: S1 RNA-binding domain-containing protein [Microcystaceae cyanobacterium]
MTATSRSAFSHDDFAKALEQHDYHADKGQIVRGKVFQHTSDGAYVEIGGKSPGFLALDEVGLDTVVNLPEDLPLDSEWEFLVISEQNADGQVKLSRRQLYMQQAWEGIIEASISERPLEVRITGINKGGVTGDVEGLRGFIPRSHLVEKNNLESLVGQVLTANVLEANQENNKLVLSQRKLLQAQAMTSIAKGTLCAGKIVKLQPYGVFVDLNGVTGLLHITQISGTRIEALDKVFQYGQQLQVAVIEVDEHKNRISLSTKILENYPGEILEKFDEVMATAEERYVKALAEHKGDL